MRGRGKGRVLVSCCGVLRSAAAAAPTSLGVAAAGDDACRGGVRAGRLFQTPLKVGGTHVSASQGAMHILLKEATVGLQDLSSFFVQRVLRVWLLDFGG